VSEIRPARPDQLVLLPALEAVSDTLFSTLGLGPFPHPGSAAELAASLVVLVVGDPPVGFARLEEVAGGAHLEQLSVHPKYVRRGHGRALVRAACDWARQAGYAEMTLVTYADVPWNGPFYASEGFAALGEPDDWYAARGLPPEMTVMASFGTRVVMVKAL
jgi:GNAT superfamily N-acetyltransferase